MPVPSLTLTELSAAELAADVLVLGVSLLNDTPVLHCPAGLSADVVPADLGALGVTGQRDELTRFPATAVAASSIALIGLGPGPVTAGSLRYAAGAATRQLRGVAQVGFALPVEDDADVQAVLEGAAIGAYSYDVYRFTSRSTAKLPVAAISVCGSLTRDAVNRDRVVQRALIAAEAVALVRDLVNAPPSDLYPETFAAEAARLAGEGGLEYRVWDEQKLAEDGFGGILGVGQGSTRPPRLVRVEYAPEAATRSIALVGKGITFDSGGLSLKPAASMIGMKYDMTGAATALAVTLAAAKLRLPVRITAWLCLAENLPSGSAIRPNDVLRIRGGKTVEVLNTDAEGRLVLADGLVAASEEHPDLIVDVATLTGAATVALGTRQVGVMGTGDAVNRVLEAAQRVGETFWQMPLPEELRPLLNSDIADIANVKPGNTAAGMLIAAVFLQEFIGTSDTDPAAAIPWAHLDIAGAANNAGSAYGFTGRGPTGVSVRALLALAEDLAAAPRAADGK